MLMQIIKQHPDNVDDNMWFAQVIIKKFFFLFLTHELSQKITYMFD